MIAIAYDGSPLRRNSDHDAAQISGTYDDDPKLDFRPHALAESIALCNTHSPWQPANHSGMSRDWPLPVRRGEP
jgi:hypothetical protein